MTDYRQLLRSIAIPRLVGSVSQAQVMELLKTECRTRGFSVEEGRLSVSPVALATVSWAGALVALSGVGAIVDAALGGPGGGEIAAGVAAWCAGGLLLAGPPPLRRLLMGLLGMRPVTGAVNLIATRPGAAPAVWLVAHYDAKGQPISMGTRLVAAVLATGGGLALAALAVSWRTGADISGAAWLAAGVPAVLGGCLLVGNAYFRDSPGAVDNASGIVTALRVIDRLPPDAPVGLLLPDGEEWGLLGAKAIARARPELLHGAAVINFDGIDDRGTTIALLHRPGPVAEALAAELSARRARWLPVVVDGAALAGAAKECVTIMRGGWHTMRIVHTARDTAERLTLEGVELVAERVAAVLRSRVSAT